MLEGFKCVWGCVHCSPVKVLVTPQSEHGAPSTYVEGPLCQVRVVTILRTSNLINLYTPDNNFLIQIIIFWKSQTYQNDKSLSSYSYKIV